MMLQSEGGGRDTNRGIGSWAVASVTVETGEHKFDASSVGDVGDSSNNQVQEIRLGGTTTKLLFESGAKTATAGGGH